MTEQEQPKYSGIEQALLPVGRSGMAIVAGYLAIVSIFLCLPAPLALITGILGLRDIKQNPEKGGKGRALFGVIVGGIGTLGIVGWVLMMILGAAVA